MKGAFPILSVHGIRLFIHWTFFLLLGWVLLVNLQSGYRFPQLFWSLLFLLATFACVALHEFGHALVAARFGIRAKNIVLLPIGGVASIEKFPANPKQELSISIAGPLVNIAIALLLLPFLQAYTPIWQLKEPISIAQGQHFLYNLHLVNLSLAAFNLIPAFPMDGGRIFRALLGFRMNYVKATTIAAGMGKFIAAIFIALGILFMNLFLPLIGLFIILSASTEEYYLRLKTLVQGLTLKDVLMYDYNSLQAGMHVQEAAGALMNNHQKYFILMEGSQPVGAINRMEIIKAIAEKKYTIPLRELLQEELPAFTSSQSVESVLENLAGSNDRIFPVMEENQFIGVVNFPHIIEYLLLHKAESQEYGRIKSLAGLLR